MDYYESVRPSIRTVDAPLDTKLKPWGGERAAERTVDLQT